MSAREGLAGLIDAWHALLSLIVPSATSAGEGLELVHPWLLLALVPVAGLIAMVALRERTTRPALVLARGEAAAALPLHLRRPARGALLRTGQGGQKAALAPSLGQRCDVEDLGLAEFEAPVLAHAPVTIDVAAGADDDVVEDADADELADLAETPGDLQVVAAPRGFTRGVA